SDRSDVPRELMVALARDEIDVAYPVIIKSKLLEDEDLIQLILERAEEHQLAVSKRDGLSEDVSDSLVNTQNSTVITSLLHNDTASIRAETIGNLVDDSETITGYRAALVKRRELEDHMAKKLYQWVGEALKESLELRFSETDMSADLEDAVSSAVSEAMYEGTFSEDLDTALEEYSPSYKPLPRTLVQALREGDVFRFEELFCDLTELPHNMVTHILYDKGPEALAICCKASGLGVQDFGDILCLLKNSANPKAFEETPVYEKMIAYFIKMNQDGAVKVLESWQPKR
ncbi:MAG: DUF2336 domain-containing protein, partial [Alphaproteobacteria bacterium]|nr:DUF2336 domain-containing protein [Alphaproteobacteria bacterium]